MSVAPNGDPHEKGHASVVFERSPETSSPAGGPDRLFAGYIFDLDGTVYLGDQLLPGSRRLFERLSSLGREVLFLSNNPTRSPEDYAAKLTRLGIPTSAEQVLNTVTTMTSWLVRHHPDATVFPISEEPLKRSLATAGIRMSEDPTQIDFVIASYDRAFDYRKLQIAFDAIRTHGRARLITTNPDRFCPLPGGQGEPDSAAIIGAVEGCTGVRCEQNTGKPDPYMLDAALDRLGLTVAECVMVGDRLGTDIRMAIDGGMRSALVLTGDTTLETLQASPPDDHPTWVIERIDHVLPLVIRTGGDDA